MRCCSEDPTNVFTTNYNYYVCSLSNASVVYRQIVNIFSHLIACIFDRIGYIVNKYWIFHWLILVHRTYPPPPYWLHWYEGYYTVLFIYFNSKKKNIISFHHCYIDRSFMFYVILSQLTRKWWCLYAFISYLFFIFSLLFQLIEKNYLQQIQSSKTPNLEKNHKELFRVFSRAIGLFPAG